MIEIVSITHHSVDKLQTSIIASGPVIATMGNTGFESDKPGVSRKF